MDDLNPLPLRAEAGRWNRRGFLKRLATASTMGLTSLSAAGATWQADPGPARRDRVRALLLSATTLPGRGSMEHAREALRTLYGPRREILLINFASLPGDRDAYAARMQRDFAIIDPAFVVRSLHQVPPVEAERAIRSADGFFVSGGNTFLLLRELYDRFVVELLRERVFSGVPYAGSSAGSNIAGEAIGTTNDFPLTDVPTRRSLALFAGVFNPHHPAESDPLFAGRQGKIDQYARYHPSQTILGVTDPGIIRLEGNALSLLGEGAAAFVQRGRLKAVARATESGSLEAALRAVGAID